MPTCNSGGSSHGGDAKASATSPGSSASASRETASRLSERDLMINDEIKSMSIPGSVRTGISSRTIASAARSRGLSTIYSETLSQQDIGKIFITTSFKGSASDPDSVSYHKTMLTGFAKGSNKPIFTDIFTGKSIGYDPSYRYNMIFR